MLPALRIYLAIAFLTFAVLPSQFAQQNSWAEHFRRGKELFHAASDSDAARLEAKREFEKVLSLNPTFAPTLAYIGLIALDNRDTAAAQSKFQKALTLDSTCAEARIGMARLYSVRGQSNEQRLELQTAIRLAPNNLFARRELVTVLLHGEGESLLDEDRRKEATPHLQAILQSDSNDSSVHDDLAQAYEYFKQWDSALIHYQASFRLRTTKENEYGSPSDMRYNIARCLENLGRYEEALEVYKTYLAELEKNQADEQTIWVIGKTIQKLQSRLKK